MKKIINFLKECLYFLIYFKKRKRFKVIPIKTSRTEKRATERELGKAVVNSFKDKYSEYLK